MSEQLAPAIEHLRQEHVKLTVAHTQLSEVVKQSLTQQAQLNKHVGKLVEEYDERIKLLERDNAVLQSRLPRRIVDGDDLEKNINHLTGAMNKRFEAVEKSVGDVDKDVRAIKTRYAWISGAAAVVGYIAANLLPMVVSWFNGK